ncbi:MAG TPA: ATP-binding protein [Thermoleophilaceae bacterium]|nr:ATP-binding protein [Thermoleophilaceae bacterium]
MSQAAVPALALAAIGLLGARVELMRRRLARVAFAEHEIRGAATALALICETWRRDAGGAPAVDELSVQLDRLSAGLADLRTARGGRPPGRGRARVELEGFLAASLAPWRAVAAVPPASGLPRVSADRGRLAQALGNLVANAAEHGRGRMEVRALPIPAGVRLEVRNRRGDSARAEPGRGRGLTIAERAARELGGRLRVDVEGDDVVAALELPVEEPRVPRAA